MLFPIPNHLILDRVSIFLLPAHSLVHILGKILITIPWTKDHDNPSAENSVRRRYTKVWLYPKSPLRFEIRGDLIEPSCKKNGPPKGAQTGG